MTASTEWGFGTGFDGVSGIASAYAHPRYDMSQRRGRPGAEPEMQSEEVVVARNHAIERVHPPKFLMQVVNPLMRALAARGRAVQNFVLILHYSGRRTGHRYDLPVGYRIVDGRVLLFTNSEWRHNFRGGREIEVTYDGHRRPAKATLIDKPEIVADVFQRRFAEMGSRAQRDLGVRVSLDRAPTREEWLDLVAREGMSIVEVEFGDGRPSGS